MANKSRDPELETQADKLGVSYQCLLYRKKHGIPLDKSPVQEFTHNGKTRTLKAWARRLGVSRDQLYNLVYYRIRQHKMTPEKAFASAVLAIEETYASEEA